MTEGPGHATELARTAASQVVVAVGGDGTINEVSNGIIGTDKVLGVIPAGSGNDFIKSIGVPSNLLESLDILLRGNQSVIDCGTISTGKNESECSNSFRHFINGVGIGFDAAVAERTTHIKHLSGTALYLAAVFQMLGKYDSPDYTIELDSRAITSRNLLIAIGNGVCAGGGFYLTPNAKVNDGRLDVCLIESMPVPRILAVMPKVMRGKHDQINSVQMKKAETINVSAPQTFFVHADGEIVGNKVNRAEVRIKKAALRVIGNEAVH